MPFLANAFNSGDNMNSRTKLMLSLVPFWFIIMVASEVVSSSPMIDRLTRRTAREDRQDNPESNRISNDLFLSRKYLNFATGARFMDAGRDPKWFHSPLSASYSYDPSTPAYFGPKLIYKEFVYNKRRKRELRTSSKGSSSSSNVPSQSSNYHPFLMAEMIPGSVKTRHPSIIAVNGCPAYYIADHRGQCRQVFQYTVNFGQRLPKYHNPPPSPPKHTIRLKNFHLHREQRPQSSTTTAAPQMSKGPGKPIPVMNTPPSPPSSSPRLLMLLRNAAKRFDLTFLKNQSSSSSGETQNEDKIDKLRRKILSALKITKNKEFSKDEAKKHDKDRRNFNSDSRTTSTTSTSTSTTKTTSSTTTTTPDYDD